MTERSSILPPDRKYESALAFAISFILLYYISWTNYLLFHTLAELFSIVTAVTIFVLAWNARRFLEYGYLLFIGISYLFVAGFDLLHMLSYKGMGVFPGEDADLPTQLWLAARYLQSFSLLVAPLFLHRRSRPLPVLLGFAGVSLLLFLSIYVWQIFPASFIEGTGLTPFKRGSEYLISGILVGASGLLFLHRRSFDRSVLRLLLLSILFSILSELIFTAYIQVTDFLNASGHYLKILAFYFIYLAIVETGFVRPYGLLFRDLKQSENALRKAHDELEVRVQERTAEVLSTNLALEEEIIKHQQAANELRQIREHLEELVQARTAELEREVLERQRAEAAATHYASRLERSNRELEDFASVASHDLQEPLRKVQAFSLLLRSHIPSGQQSLEITDLLDRIQRAVQRMTDMIDGLLAYSRVNTKAHPYTSTDLNQVVAEVLNDLEIRIAETGGKVEVDPLPTLDADPLQMRLLFQNLIGNALKFHKPDLPPLVKITSQGMEPTNSPENASPGGEDLAGHWEANAEHTVGSGLWKNYPAPNFVEIVVSDNGIGFEDQFAEKLFAPFQRLVGRSQYQGSGIGLAICRKIVERHGGQIAACGRPGEGADFIVRLPLRQPQPAALQEQFSAAEGQRDEH